MAANALPIAASFPPSRTDPHTQIPPTFLCCLPSSRSQSPPSSNLHAFPLLPSRFPSLSTTHRPHVIVSCLPSSPGGSSTISTKLYVSGLSFRTTEETLRNAFQNFGQLVEVNLVMDRIANRPRGFAFLRYATDEESRKAIEGMHGKFLDGRVIFVEPAKPRSELRRSIKESPRPY